MLQTRDVTILLFIKDLSSGTDVEILVWRMML
jgi:hypothetical protein